MAEVCCAPASLPALVHADPALLLALIPAVMACSAAGPCSIGKVWDGTPTGTTAPALGGLATYVAAPSSPASPPRVVLQITDIFGVHKV
jgi:hypothetical protein